ncbi:uncharacterized protein LOC115626480 [Scaptodrosophila lebanonensis]|uniref:Uncharacterized protein LOC115626480 n=1 Tax=Drosophila lebanonensis TaxID=7225 RepID=A0A6J2TS02_DROLE|nr:uncharacterized protein LOC115626480 [Scaptodrosophila lebanonensis]
MAEKLAIYLTALFQVLGCSFFFTQPEDQCSPAPSLASWIFLLATLCYLWDTCIFPQRFCHIPRYYQVIFEIVACVLITEVGMLIIWCAFERVIYAVVQELLLFLGLSGCRPWCFEYWVLGLLTTAVSGAILCCMLDATDGLLMVMKFYCGLRRSLTLSWKMLKCYWNMNGSARRRALKVCQLANRCAPRNQRARRRCCQQTADDPDDNDDEENDDDEQCDEDDDDGCDRCT